jgi:uncharacterized protein
LREKIGRRGAPQFKYFNSFTDAERDSVDVLICDEAHRIRDTSNNRFTRKEKQSNLRQIEELLNVAKAAVFFIDDDQVVRPNEVGSISYIKQYAKENNCNVLEYELDIQFRCGGSESFVNWIDNTLDIKKTPNIIWSKDEAFDFQIFGSPKEVEKRSWKKPRRDTPPG